MSRLAEHMVSVQSEAANVQTDAGQCQEFGQEEARHYMEQEEDQRPAEYDLGRGDDLDIGKLYAGV